MTLKGTFPVNSIAEKTILPIQRKKISLALKIISVGKNVVKSLVFLGHPKVANGQSAEENQVSSTSPSPSTGTLCPHQSCLEIFQSLTFRTLRRYAHNPLLSAKNFVPLTRKRLFPCIL